MLSMIVFSRWLGSFSILSILILFRLIILVYLIVLCYSLFDRYRPLSVSNVKNSGIGDFMKKYIWGTGRLTGMVIGRFINLEDIEGFIDNNENKSEFMGKKVYHPAEFKSLQFDAIIVSNLFSKEIYIQCDKLGMDMSKFIFLYSNCSLQDMNKDYCFVEKVLGKEYADIVRKRHHVIRGVDAFGDLCFKGSPFEDMGYLETDYVRIKSFELAVKELRKRKIPGSVAEAGVFRGEFAQYINWAFPDRKCYLFDTFDGFDANEALKEVKAGNCTPAFVEAYKQTNLKMVLDRMTNLDNVVIKQGFFPSSLGGMEDTFAFVSLDMDFEDSIYEGIKYFFPRLSKGGYIFIHDYNSDLQGVEKAVDRYESEIGSWLAKVPLSDKSGTLVVTRT